MGPLPDTTANHRSRSISHWYVTTDTYGTDTFQQNLELAPPNTRKVVLKIMVRTMMSLANRAFCITSSIIIVQY